MKRTIVVLGLVLALIVVAACGSSSKQARPPQPFDDLRGKKRVSVTADSNLFTPDKIIIDTGTTVTWKNTDTVAHNVKKSVDLLDFGAPFGVDAGKFGPGESYSFTFRKSGHFFYTCTIHAGMSGEVQVGTSGSTPIITVPRTSTTTG